MKPTDLAYVAGIIDGEGSIGIAKHRSKSCKAGYSLELCVQVTTSDEWLCRWLRFSFGGSCTPSINSVGNPMWHWYLASRQALAFLSLIKRYLKLKADQAALATKFQGAKRHRSRITDEERTLEEQQRITLQNMHRGRNGSHKGLGRRTDQLRQEMRNKLERESR